ncbi:MAG: response regulator, partial [Chloroflexota bacterium]
QTNMELEQQASRLEAQQIDLENANRDLEDRTRQLEDQNREVEHKNHEIEIARADLQEQAEQLALTSKYKSEFLTNMSHELRTPLNSMLILAQLLSDNKAENLSEKQVEYAQTIHASGSDLLGLINEILDLSKVEAGAATVELGRISLDDTCNIMERNFRQLANEQALDFQIERSESLPTQVVTDGKRLNQVLRNLLSNAFKFTETGGIVLKIDQARGGWARERQTLNEADYVIAFTVTDSGIGIPVDKQRVIFETFQQVDGTISRKYGGTGLGLAISREIARLLGGDLMLAHSELNVGSTFVFYLPQNHHDAQADMSTGGVVSTPTTAQNYAQRFLSTTDDVSPASTPILVEPTQQVSRSVTSAQLQGQTKTQPRVVYDAGQLAMSARQPNQYSQPVEQVNPPSYANYTSHAGPAIEFSEQVDDDRFIIQASDPVALIIEDDANFARVLLSLAHERGFKGIVALQGETGLELAQTYQPDAITLDLNLPAMNGWAVLDQLKNDMRTRHIPVHIITADSPGLRGFEQGAIGVVEKPVTSDDLHAMFDQLLAFKQRTKSLLVIEDDEAQRNSIVDLVSGDDIETVAVATGEEALKSVAEITFDCIVLDLSLPDIDGVTLLEKLQAAAGRDIPVR